MNKYNIIWIIIDGVRTFRTNLDDRDRLDIMDEFGKDSIEFTNAFTSAPSSILSGGAFFTGLPSVYVSRHFNDFKFADKKISTIATLVEDYGYDSFPLINTREEREKYQFVLPPFQGKYLPKGRKLSDYAWRNREITEIIEHLIEKNIPRRPFSLACWYCCRRDPRTSEYVGRALELLKKNGYFENSVIIMHSDHGYPHPATKLNKGFFKGLRHDMILTDDNIRTPLFLKYPGGPKGIRVSNVVGLIDILPTIFDILNVPRKEIDTKYQGRSLLPILRGEEADDTRIVRTDSRLTMDIGKITSLRSSEYKYLFFYDENYEALYDMKRDPGEGKSLIRDGEKAWKNVLKEFRKLLKNYETELSHYHETQLRRNCRRSFSVLQRKYSNEKLKIAIVSKAPVDLLKILVCIVNETFECDVIDLIYSGNEDVSKIDVKDVYDVKNISAKEVSKLNLKRYSLVINLTENSHRVFLKPTIIKGVKTIPSRDYRLINFNFELFNYFRSKWFPQYARLFFDWEVKGYFYKQEPLYFLKDITWFIKTCFSQVFLKSLDVDRVAAKEIMEFRDYHLKGNRAGLVEMDNSQIARELVTIKTRER